MMAVIVVSPAGDHDRGVVVATTPHTQSFLRFYSWAVKLSTPRTPRSIQALHMKHLLLERKAIILPLLTANHSEFQCIDR